MAGAEAVAAEGQLLNPPYIHHVAVAPSAERPSVRLAAAARGDGAIAIYDMDAQVTWQLTAPCTSACHMQLFLEEAVRIVTKMMPQRSETSTQKRPGNCKKSD